MSDLSGIKEFPDPNLIAAILYENKLITGPSVNDAMNTPEFQVFRIIGQNKMLTTEEIETKFEVPQSLSMILSNLQADYLIEQTSEYKWKISATVWDLLAKAKDKALEQREKKLEDEKIKEQQLRMESKKSLYKRIAEQLQDNTYAPDYLTVEQLFEVPEIEILVIIYENEPIGADEIENHFSLDGSVSLSLSNLSADNLIQQTSDYKYKMHPNLRDVIEETVSVGSASDSSDQTTDLDAPVQQAAIIENKQLLKALLDMNYFMDKSVNDILETVEFEILSIIYSNSPISADEIEAKMTQETLLSMILSNLSADGLIEASNDYRWVLTEDFRITVSKIKVSRNEIMEQMTKSQPKPKMTEPEQKTKQQVYTSTLPRPTNQAEKKEEVTEKPSVGEQSRAEINPLIADLIKYNYITDPNISDQALEKIPEYIIIRLISQHQPISADQLDQMISDETISTSLTLSNLSADGIIEQTNDYEYLLIKSYDLGTEKIVQNELPVEKHQVQDEVTQSDGDHENLHHKPKFADDLKLKTACFKSGYITDMRKNPDELRNVPEFEVLKIIGEHQPVTEETIKEYATSVGPVHISRMVLKLEADRRIERLSDGSWQYTSNFEELLNEDEIKARKRLEELKREKEEKERARQEKEKKERKKIFLQILSKNPVFNMPQETDINKLMGIPEFEVLWIISENDGITAEEIKTQAVSTTPVMITRTITQLETSGMIKSTGKNGWKLSEMIFS